MKRAGKGLIAFAALILLALCTGCLEKRIVWSPDGSRAVVIGEHGLYLCDAAGGISPLLVPNVGVAAWVDDATLAFVRRRQVGSWSEVKQAIGDESGPLETQAAELWRRFEEGAPWSVLMIDLHDRLDPVKMCLRDGHATALKARLTPEEWRTLEQQTVELRELLTARVDGMQLQPGRVMYSHLKNIAELRPAPNRRAIAWTQDMMVNDDFGELMIAPLSDAPAPAIRVAQRVAAYPDWQADGSALVYVEAAAGAADAKDDTIVLGVLTKRGVVEHDGRITVADKPEYLAGVVFNPLTHVRCLRDGRILFNAVEMALPVAASDLGGDQREQLFAVDPSRQATLVRLIPRRHEGNLSQSLSFFEVSPDEREVVIGGLENEVAVLTLATGDVTVVQDGAKTSYKGVPVWRRAGELTYVKRKDAKESRPGRRAEIVVRMGDRESVLSQAWTDETLADIAHRDRD